MKPILFNTEMTKAILEGRKSVTRRAIRLDLGMASTDNLDSSYLYIPDQYGDYHDAKDLFGYRKGDIIYVRETWKMQSMSNFDKRVKFMYKADGDKDLEIRHVTDDRYEKLLKYASKNGWQPSLFMPKEAARIFLKVTDVRVERLQDINGQGHHDDILKEGLIFQEDTSPVKLFKDLWNSTVKKADLDKYGWEANPFVWVIEFERVEIGSDGN